MRYATLRKTAIAAVLIGAAALVTSAFAHGGYGGGWGTGHGMMGPGMMEGYGAGAGGGYGPGYGMGPGMMGGGMMGHGMGHGMMGRGMMGGMGYGILGQLNLSPEQWKKVSAVHEDIAKKQWALMGKMREEGFKLRSLLASEKRDRDALTNQFKKVQDIRLQMFQARLDGHEKLNGILTSEQKAQLRRFAPWWGHDIE